jgi:hypothetical protein
MYYLLLNCRRKTSEACVGPHHPHSVESDYDDQTRSTYLVAVGLHQFSVHTSTSMHERRSLVTDGPFVETRELLGG